MTPQPRHIEAAKKAIEQANRYVQCDCCGHVGYWVSTRGENCPNNEVNVIALALAAAENRAAWAGFVAGGPRGVAAYWGNNDNAKEHDEAFEALFGPRPAKENPHA